MDWSGVEVSIDGRPAHPNAVQRAAFRACLTIAVFFMKLGVASMNKGWPDLSSWTYEELRREPATPPAEPDA